MILLQTFYDFFRVLGIEDLIKNKGQ